MKIYQILKWGKKQFELQGIQQIEAQLLLEYTLQVPFSRILAQYQKCVSQEQEERYKGYVEKRLQGVPLQYITHEQSFMGEIFYVDESVLIPRPETELLVEAGLIYLQQCIRKNKRNINVLDMCTGSGCILISLINQLKLEIENIECQWLGVDIQEEALKISRYNEQKILKKEEIKWIQSDLFSKIESNATECFDLIVSNPPYIPQQEVEVLMPEVKNYEPRVALDGGVDGLFFYRRIIEESRMRLRQKGQLIFEIGHGQMQDIKTMMLEAGFIEIKEIKDMAGLERIISGIKP